MWPAAHKKAEDPMLCRMTRYACTRSVCCRIDRFDGSKNVAWAPTDAKYDTLSNCREISPRRLIRLIRGRGRTIRYTRARARAARRRRKILFAQDTRDFVWSTHATFVGRQKRKRAFRRSPSERYFQPVSVPCTYARRFIMISL